MTPPTPPWICPSILAADFARLGEEVSDVLAAGADTIPFDAMDNHHGPTLSVGPLVLSALRKAGIDACIDVHLMVKPVDRLVEDFLAAGAAFIPSSLEKLRQARGMIDACGRDIRLQIDGGIKIDNIGAAAAAGADAFVAGTAIFGADNYAATISAMRNEIADA